MRIHALFRGSCSLLALDGVCLRCSRPACYRSVESFCIRDSGPGSAPVVEPHIFTGYKCMPQCRGATPTSDPKYEVIDRTPADIRVEATMALR